MHAPKEARFRAARDWVTTEPMTKRRQIAIVAAAATLLLALVAGSLRWELPDGLVKSRLETALIRDTGYRIRSLGSASFTALPWPILQVAQLELDNRAVVSESASIPLAKARLNVFSWLIGDPRLSALTLFEPKLNLVGSDRLEEADAVATIVANYLREGRRPAMTHLRVRGGEVTLDGGRWLSGLMLTVSNIASRDLRLQASGDYRALPFRLKAEVAPSARGAARPVLWDFDLGDLAASFQGVLVAPPSLDAEGRISVALGAGALRSRPFMLSRELGGLLDGVSIMGEGRLSLPQVQLRSVIVERRGARLRGGIDAVLSTTAPRIAGTLHAESLDVSLANALAATSAFAGSSERPLDHRWLRSLHADVRLSADRVAIGGVRMQEAAASMKIGGNRLEVSLSEGRVGGGVLKGRAALMRSAERLDARLALQMSQIDLAAAFGSAVMPLVAGSGSGQAAIEMSGSTLPELVASASGRGNIAVRNGEFAGLDIERFLRRLESPNDPLPDGRSSFRSLDLTWRMAAGVASISDASLRGSLWSGRIEGDVDFRRQQLDLLARLMLDRPSGRGEERALHLHGPMMAPSLRALMTTPGRS
jgi:AsmA protein